MGNISRSTKEKIKKIELTPFFELLTELNNRRIL